MMSSLFVVVVRRPTSSSGTQRRRFKRFCVVAATTATIAAATADDPADLPSSVSLVCVFSSEVAFFGVFYFSLCLGFTTTGIEPPLWQQQRGNRMSRQWNWTKIEIGYFSSFLVDFFFVVQRPVQWTWSRLHSGCYDAQKEQDTDTETRKPLEWNISHVKGHQWLLFIISHRKHILFIKVCSLFIVALRNHNYRWTRDTEQNGST